MMHLLASTIPALHELHDAAGRGQCVAPGRCTPPPAQYSKVVAGPKPG